MKMQLKSMLLLMGVSFLIFVGCEKKDSVVAPPAQSSAVADADESWTESNSLSSAEKFPVSMTTTTLTQVGTGPGRVLKTGTFVASKQIGDSGIYVMDIRFFGAALDSIHCITTFYPYKGGSYTSGSKCSIITNLGEWHYIYGTFHYKNLHGNGTVSMIPSHEMATGKAWFE